MKIHLPNLAFLLILQCKFAVSRLIGFLLTLLLLSQIAIGQVNITPSTVEVCEGGDASFVVNTSGNDSLYIWSHNSQILGTTPLLIIPTNSNNFPVGTYSIQCKIIYQGAMADSSTAQLIVSTSPQPPSLTKTPNVSQVCEGALLSASGTLGNGGAGNCTIEYRYLQPGQNWAPGNSFTASGTGVARIQARTICDGAGCDTTMWTQAQVTWIVVEDPEPPILTKTPQVDEVCEGAQLSATAVLGSGGTDSCVIEYRYRQPGQDWISGNSFTVIGTGTARIQARTICDGIGCDTTAWTQSQVSWTVVEDPQTPSLTKIPATDTVCEGEILTVLATANNGGTGDCDFVFEYQQPNAGLWISDSSFAATGEGIARLRVKTTCSGVGCEDSPYEEVSWVVVPSTDISVSASDTILCLGESIELQAEVSADAISCPFEWERSNDAGQTWSAIPNGAAQISDIPSEPGLIFYRCQYVCSSLECASVTSEVIEVEVFAVPSVIPFDDSICHSNNLIVELQSDVPGSTIFWSGSDGTSGIDTILISEAPVSTPQSFTYEAFPISQNLAQCVGDTIQGAITILPIPEEVQFSDQNPVTLCKGTENPIINITNPLSELSYRWYTRSFQDSLLFAGDTTPFLKIQKIPDIDELNLSISVSNEYSCFKIGNIDISISEELAPDPQPIALNLGEILVSLDNQADSYQWGYDLKTSLEPIFLEGEVFQDYFTQGTLDTTQRYYWVQTFHGECYTRTYYNGPEFVLNLEELDPKHTGIKIFMDRHHDRLNVILIHEIRAPISLKLIDISGRSLYSKQVLQNVGWKIIEIPLNELPHGLYILQALNPLHSISSFRFIY